MHAVRIIEIPDCKMVSSGIGMFGEEKFGKFHSWFSALPHSSIYPRNFLFWDGEPGVSGGFHWLYLYDESLAVPDGFEIIDFKGGLYAVATDIDGQTDLAAMDAAKDVFLKENGFERDAARPALGNVTTGLQAQKIMGYSQMDYYTPVKPR
jgi:AraC family transcriptional regulator